MIKLIITDIDGTLFDITHRLHYIQKEPKDWGSFNKECVNDEPIINTLEVVKNLSKTIPIVACTGRKESIRMETFNSLHGCFLFPELLLMRKDRDYRPDYVIKREMLLKLLSNFDIKPSEIIVFEDRQSVVDMWREEGCTVYQVANGDF